MRCGIKRVRARISAETASPRVAEEPSNKDAENPPGPGVNHVHPLAPSPSQASYRTFGNGPYHFEQRPCDDDETQVGNLSSFNFHTTSTGHLNLDRFNAHWPPLHCGFFAALELNSCHACHESTPLPLSYRGYTRSECFNL
ncbi:hypothetical protein TNCV_2340771 [Trichonephila clavipes]|nr:hypothetical protein TNCV_2340771 [Trichonephila clavipes]